MNNSPIGTTWKEYKETRMTAKERNKMKLKADIVCEILESLQQQGLTQDQLEGKTALSSRLLPGWKTV